MKNKKIVICLLMLAIMGLSGKTKASDGPTLAVIINTFADGGGTGGDLTATWDGATSTLTVVNTGNVPLKNVTQTLTLDINAGVRVLWQAELEGSTAVNIALIDISN